MEIEVQLTRDPIPEKFPPSASCAHGAWLEFRGVVRGEEHGCEISALEYEAYPDMASHEIRRLLQEIGSRHPCLAATVVHRIGVIPAGETAIYAGIVSAHRGEAIALLTEFMDRLKEDVPIWKRRAVGTAAKAVGEAPIAAREPRALPKPEKTTASTADRPHTLDSALDEVMSRCPPLPAVRASLGESFGRTLRETVRAPEDLPDCDRSTRDGYAILEDDPSAIFQIMDTLQAADWKPRQMQRGECARVSTGAALPCGGLRVVMQENVRRDGDKIHVIQPERDSNARRRGEDVKAGATLLHEGALLDAGTLAVLASAGCVRPLVSPRLHVVHFTTGNEIVPPEQEPGPGQIRDSNSILLRCLLQKFGCEVSQGHLPENFDTAKAQCEREKRKIENADLILVSGGASVGDNDFTRSLVEWLGFQIAISGVAVRPGRPMIFGVDGRRVAFGLPGNPLAHFVCYHLFVGTALAKMNGLEPKRFLRGRMAARLPDTPNSRETLWPARCEPENGELQLQPLNWSSSGDVTCLSRANALIRVPPSRGALDVGAEVDFFPAGSDSLWQ